MLRHIPLGRMYNLRDLGGYPVPGGETAWERLLRGDNPEGLTEEDLRWLLDRDRFLILTHIRPDGDTTGCAIALCLGLRSLGKDAWIWENPQFSGRFLPRMDGMLRTDLADDATLVAVDMATESLLPHGAEAFAGKAQLCIDHHPSNTFYAADTLLDATCAACGERTAEPWLRVKDGRLLCLDCLEKENR